MTRALTLLLLLCLSLPAWGGELSLTPPVVHDGEVALLRWTGEPLTSGRARFRGLEVPLYADPTGAVALLPVGLGVPPGRYPVAVTTVDGAGRTTAGQLFLEVRHKPRPEERLSLPERVVTPSTADTERIDKERALLDELFGRRTSRLWTTFSLPVDDAVGSVFGRRRVLNGKPKSPHSGTDFRSAAGTPVRAIGDGRVALVADLFYTGNTVVVDHGEGLFSLYAHLSEALVAPGSPVGRGALLGRVGSTGRATGAHLHLTVRLLDEKVDPLALLTLFEK